MQCKIFFLLVCMMLCAGGGTAQNRFFTNTGHIWFTSEAILEDIVAHNRKAVSIIDLSTGEMVFTVPIQEFDFKKSLMQTHFNENYMESAKYPKATFAGRISNMKELDLTKDGTHQVQVSGILTIRGKEKKVHTVGTLVLQNGSITASSGLMVKPEEFNIEIPFLVRDHIAKEIFIQVEMIYKPYTKQSP